MSNLKLNPTAGKRLTSSLNRFGQASFELLSDFLSTLNNQNKSNLEKVSSLCGNFKDKRVVAHAFLICEEFRLDPLVAYHAIEILERFMLKHIENLLSQQKREVCNSNVCGFEGNYEDLVFQCLKDKFLLFIISSVRIASKVTLHAKVIDNSSALKYLQTVGTDCPKEKILESELLILKTLDFRVNVPNPLVYTETLLEVLGHNDPTTPVAHLHHLCTYVLQFVYLQRKSIYRSLLMAVTGRLSPTSDQRSHRRLFHCSVTSYQSVFKDLGFDSLDYHGNDSSGLVGIIQMAKFLSVTEDCMLLGVGVIAVAAFIYQTSTWEQVVEELALITGISAKSIMDFAYVTLVHIINKKVQ